MAECRIIPVPLMTGPDAIYFAVRDSNVDRIWIDVDSPGGEIAGRTGTLRWLIRRGRARRYSRTPAWRLRARRNRLVI